MAYSPYGRRKNYIKWESLLNDCANKTKVTDDEVWLEIFKDARWVTVRKTKRRLSKKEILKKMYNRSRKGDKYINLVKDKGYHYVYYDDNEIMLVDILQDGYSIMHNN